MMVHRNILTIIIIASLLILLTPNPNIAGIQAGYHAKSYAPVPSRFGDAVAESGRGFKVQPNAVTGNKRVLVIFLQFTDYSHDLSISSIMGKVQSVDAYFREVSYGALQLSIDNLNFWITLNHTMAYYGADSADQIDVNWDQYVYDSLAAADQYVNYQNYDYVMLVHAGHDQAYSGNPNDLWSRASIGKWYFSYDGGVYLGFMIISEHDPYGVFSHELGHNFVLPDLYDHSYQQEFVGKWSLMAKGAWLSPPSSVMAVEKTWMGWIPSGNITVVNRDVVERVALSPLETPGDTLMVKIPVGSIYYTVEYRRRIKTDSDLPDWGIIIAKVDESKGSGEGPVRIVDRNPYTQSKDDAAFKAGDVYKNLNDDFYVKVESLDSSTAVLLVQNGIPELYVDSDISFYGEPGNVSISVIIPNSGGPAKDFYVSIYIDGNLVDEKLVNWTVNRGYAAGISFDNLNISAGNHTLRVVADSHDNVIERDEGNNEYATTISIEGIYKLDRYVASDDRADVGSNQKLWIHFSYYSNSTDYSNKPVYLNGVEYITNGSGWVEINVSLDTVGAVEYQVTDINATQLVIPRIIFDKVIIILNATDTRIDVGSEAIILHDSYYAYDGKPFDGFIKLNDTTIKDVVGKYWYTTSEIFDPSYNLTVFESNTVYVIFDRVRIGNLTVPDNRVNVGAKNIQIDFDAYYEYDSTPFDGTLVFNDTIPKNAVGKFWYRVVGIRDHKYGLTKFTSNGTLTFYIIYDRVNVTLTVEDERIDVGSRANISFSAYYMYDGKPYNGDIVLNDSLVKDVVGEYWYTVESIGNDMYGITAFVSNTVSVVFDRVNITLSIVDNRINVGDEANISINAYYEYDGALFNGTVVLNGSLVQDEVGRYIYRAAGIIDPLYNVTAFETNSVSIIFDAVNVTIIAGDSRIDVGSTANVTLVARYAYDGSPYLGEVALNDTLTKDIVGKYWYGAVLVEPGPYGITKIICRPAYVIFDRVRIEMAADNRVNVGDDALKGINAYYEYDGEKFEGTIFLNDTTIKYEVGKYWFLVRGINDTKYGLTKYIAEPVSVIFDKVIINLYPTRERYDAGMEAEIGIDARYAYDGARYDGEIVFNDSLIKLEPGRFTYTVAAIGNDTYGITVFESNSVTIVFDRVSVTLWVDDERINVGDNANITWTAYYEYDHTPFNGSIFLNDTTTKNIVGKYTYAVASIIDPNYGLTAFKSNTVSVIFDKVNVTLIIDDERINVEDEANILIDAYYMYDGEPYSGDVLLNGSLIQEEVGKYTYTVAAVGNDTYGITEFESNSVTIIFDRVVIELHPTHNRIRVGEKADVNWTAYYEYDGTPFSGKVKLNDTLIHDELGVYHYTTSSIEDDLYGLTRFKSNVITIIFDRPRVEVDIDTMMPFQYRVVVKVFSQAENKYIKANITINGEEAKAESDGHTYTYTYKVDLLGIRSLDDVKRVLMESLSKEFRIDVAVGDIEVRRYRSGQSISSPLAMIATVVFMLLLLYGVSRAFRRH